MRYLISGGIVIVMMILCLSGTPSAAQGDIPPGTYRQTCQDIQLDGNTLYATCESTGRQWHKTSLHHLDRCVGDITNIDGNLRCDTKGSLPPGDYTLTCKKVRMHLYTLYAQCKDRHGRWVDTTLEYYNLCTRPIANVDGQLQCGRGGNGD